MQELTIFIALSTAAVWGANMPSVSGSGLLGAMTARAPVVNSTVPAPSLRRFRPTTHRSAVSPVEAEFRRVGSLITRSKGRAIIEQGDPATYVFRVVDGLLRAVLLLPDGRRYVVRFVWPDDFFGFGSADRHLYTVEAIVGVKLIRYKRAHLDELMAAHPQARLPVARAVDNELLSAQDHLLMLGRKTALERVASFLVEMAARRTDPAQIVGREARLPMTRVDIADYLGLTMETVSRVLTRLRRRRIVALPTADRIVLLNRAALVRLAGCEAKMLRP